MSYLLAVLLMWISLVTLKTAIFVIVAASLHEIFCVKFVYYANKHDALMTGVVAMLAGQCSVIAWMIAINEQLYSPFMIIGWGIGAFLGVKFKIGQS